MIMSDQLRFLVGVATIFISYIASNFAMATVVPALYGMHCEVTFLATQCDFGSDVVEPLDGYIILGSLIVTSLVAIHLFWRETIFYPFVFLFGLLGLGTIAIDVTWQNPVINSAKIVNDTINILGSVIAVSFLLLILILRHQRYSMIGLAKSALISYLVKVTSVTGFIAVRAGVHGSTELYLLYVVYAFGAFSLHLMTVCGFLSRTVCTEPKAAAR